MKKNIREKFYYKPKKNYIKCSLSKFSSHSNFLFFIFILKFKIFLFQKFQKVFNKRKKNGIKRSYWLKYFVCCKNGTQDSELPVRETLINNHLTKLISLP